MSEQLTSKNIAIQYEARLLGSLMVNPDQFEDVSDIVGFDDFVGPNHDMIFQAIAGLRQAKEPVHPLAVSENIARSAIMLGQTAKISLSFLQEMANQAGPAGARSDAGKVRERSALRRLSDAGQQIQQLADDASATPEAIVEQISEIAQSTAKTIETRGAMVDNFIPFNRAMMDYVTKLSALAENPETVDGINLGVEDIDAYLGFLSPGFHILAARPGCGKTALSLQFAFNATESTEQRPKSPVDFLFMSMDMTLDKVMMRALAQKSGVTIGNLRRGDLSDLDWTLITKALTDIQSEGKWFDPTRNITTADFASRVRRFIREKRSRNGLVFIDYIQQMTPPPSLRLYTQTPAEYVSKFISDLAKETGLIFIALAQLNRASEQRANKRPMLSDLKGTGQLEQDADSIFFLYRDPKIPNVVEFIAAKNREGEPNHTVDLGFQGSKQQFYQVDQRSGEERESASEPYEPKRDRSSRSRF